MKPGAIPRQATPRLKGGRIAIAIVVAAGIGAVAGGAAHLLAPSKARTAALPLPDLHGQAAWAAGQRRAPPFTLHDVMGGTGSLASFRGHVALIAFLDSRCRSLCPIIGRAIGDVQRSLPSASRPVVLVVSVDPAGDQPASVRSAARRWRLAPGWHWLSGTRQQLTAVWRAYGIVVRPMTNDIVHGAAVYLVDPRGYERAGYLAPLLPNFLTLDIRRVEAGAT
jgi:cytochrome oxidase Cu insertion factor (SCO1/SenC/PrrC family)